MKTHGGNYQCSFCGSTFYLLSNLRCHERKVHGKIDFYECDLCEKKFSSKLQMKEHFKNEHNVQLTKTVTVYELDNVHDVYDS